MDTDNPVANEHPMRGLVLGCAIVAIFAAAAAGVCAGCATEEPRGVYDFVTNSIQRAVTQLEKTRERDSVQAGSAAAEAAAADPAAAEAAATAAGPRLDFRFGGFRGGGAVEDPSTQIRDFRMDSRGMSYAWATGDLSNWGLARESAGALICAFFWDDSTQTWIGGKFDWISTSRLTRDWENIRGGYNGWKPDLFFSAKRHAICIVSADGRRRTNLITD